MNLLLRGLGSRGLPAGPVEEGFGGHQFGRHLGQHERDGLEVVDGPIELHPLPSETVGELQKATRCPDSSRSDHQAFFDEPVLG